VNGDVHQRALPRIEHLRQSLDGHLEDATPGLVDAHRTVTARQSFA
jgi:hypothetical protein